MPVTRAALLALVSAAQGASALALQSPGLPRVTNVASRAPRSAFVAMAESDTDASATSTGLTAGGDAITTASGTKVKVRVRKPGAGGAKAKTPSKPADDLPEDDDTTDMKITVKAAPPPPPPPPPRGPALTEAEKMLLDGTQRANCTTILKALQDGANPNVQDPKGRTPLHFMSGVGLAPAVMLLIHYGAQLNVRDDEGLTPMHMAAGYANAKTLRVLIGAGADNTLEGNTQGPPIEIVMNLGEYQYK